MDGHEVRRAGGAAAARHMRVLEKAALVAAVAIGVFLTGVQFNVTAQLAAESVHRPTVAANDEFSGLDHGLVSFADTDDDAAAAPMVTPTMSTSDRVAAAANSLAAAARSACDCCTDCPGADECCCEGDLFYCSSATTDVCVKCDSGDAIP